MGLFDRGRGVVILAKAIGGVIFDGIDAAILD